MFFVAVVQEAAGGKREGDWTEAWLGWAEWVGLPMQGDKIR